MTPLTSVDQPTGDLAPAARDDIPRQRARSTETATTVADPVDFMPVKSVKAAAKEPTRLGRYVLSRMGELGMARQVDLVRASGISESTVSRIVLHANYTPDRDTLVALAGALRVDPKALVLFVFDLEDAPTAPPTLVPRAMQVDQLLSPTSHIDPAERELIDAMIGRVIAPYFERRRKPRAG
jgi:transcriptional regulator with XRE-family HTH domain